MIIQLLTFFSKKLKRQKTSPQLWLLNHDCWKVLCSHSPLTAMLSFSLEMWYIFNNMSYMFTVYNIKRLTNQYIYTYTKRDQCQRWKVRERDMMGLLASHLIVYSWKSVSQTSCGTQQLLGLHTQPILYNKTVWRPSRNYDSEIMSWRMEFCRWIKVAENRIVVLYFLEQKLNSRLTVFSS